MKRRDFIAGIGSSAALTACTSGTEQQATTATNERITWRMVTTWPRNFPALGTGAQRVADRIQKHLFNDGALTVGANTARWLARADQVEAAIIGESARWGDAREGEVINVPPTSVVPLITVDQWRASIAEVVGYVINLEDEALAGIRITVTSKVDGTYRFETESDAEGVFNVTVDGMLSTGSLAIRTLAMTMLESVAESTQSPAASIIRSSGQASVVQSAWMCPSRSKFSGFIVSW